MPPGQQSYQGAATVGGHQPGEKTRCNIPAQIYLHLVHITGASHGLNSGNVVCNRAKSQLAGQWRSETGGQDHGAGPVLAFSGDHGNAMLVRLYGRDPLPKQVAGSGVACPVCKRRDISYPIDNPRLRCRRFETDVAAKGRDRLDRCHLTVDKTGVDGKSADTFLANDAGAEFVTDVASPVDHSHAVAHLRQTKGGVVAGRPGTHHYHIHVLHVSHTSLPTGSGC